MSDADTLLRILIRAGKVPQAYRGPEGRPVLEVRTAGLPVRFSFTPEGNIADVVAGDVGSPA